MATITGTSGIDTLSGTTGHDTFLGMEMTDTAVIDDHAALTAADIQIV